MPNRLRDVVASSAILMSTVAGAQEPNIERLPAEIYLQNPGNVPKGADSSVYSIDVLQEPESSKVAPKTRQDFDEIAKSLILKNPAVFGLSATDFVLKEVRTGLTGSAVDYQQNLNGIPVLEGLVGVTIDASGAVTSVSKSLVEVPKGKLASVATEYKLSEGNALDIVKADLRPSGKLIEAPKVSKAYVAEGNALTLAYVVTLAVQQPFGYWEYRIDGVSGRIIDRFDRGIRRIKRAGDAFLTRPRTDLAPLVLSLQAQGALDDRAAITQKSAQFHTASALIFLPNPVTALDRPDLRDGNGASEFDPAYQKVQLNGVVKDGGKYVLSGGTIRLADFEPGEGGRSVAPSTVDTEWTARRGDNAFNDVMIFYYLNQSVDYLRGLGYRDAAELFREPIAVDSDGLNGDDNSHYVPFSDVLAFGHGGVDDAEDADVILHELGHAISYHLNPNWGGGDSGAIGEGFGDYWAVSYRLRLQDGMRPDPGAVFPWDGTGWGGRRVDVKDAQYDPTQVYHAHSSVNGVSTDELWSTPLVEALLELKKTGVPLDAVDKIVLEGMRDAGSNFTMRTLAANTVMKAELLFPGKGYAEVFAKKFKQHSILQ